MNDFLPEESVHQAQSEGINEEDKQASGTTAFEVILDTSELEFIQKLMPKGFCVTNSFKITRPRVVKYVIFSNERLNNLSRN